MYMKLGSMCRPSFTESKSTVIRVEDMRHPFITLRLGNDFIPNDLAVSKEEGSIMILTGPNMGGKSTLLRQVCIVIIMAQIGCWVPATSCCLSPIDRIFTRIGANDDIMGGHSTFMVELQETSNMLKYVTSHSLVILDELGTVLFYCVIDSYYLQVEEHLHLMDIP